MYGSGISRVGEVLDVALNLGIASKSGAWFSYGDERLGQGRVNVENMLKENEELYKKIEADVIKAIRPSSEEEEPEEDKDEKEVAAAKKRVTKEKAMDEEIED